MKNEDSLKRLVSENRAAFEKKQPDPAVRERIWERLGKTGGHTEDPIQAQPKTSTVVRPLYRSPRFWYAAASLVLLCTLGIMGGLWVLKDPADMTGQLAEVKQMPVTGQGLDTETGEGAGTLVQAETGNGQDHAVSGMSTSITVPVKKLVRQDSEISQESKPRSAEDLSQLESRFAVMLSVNEPASRRMESILQLAALPELPQNLMDGLLYMVNHDPNSNVRSAAIGLLMERLPPRQTAQAIQEIFIRQDDPSIQVELMLAMAQHDTIRINEKTADRLFAIAEDPLALDFVKTQAYAVLMKAW